MLQKYEQSKGEMSRRHKSIALMTSLCYRDSSLESRESADSLQVENPNAGIGAGTNELQLELRKETFNDFAFK